MQKVMLLREYDQDAQAAEQILTDLSLFFFPAGDKRWIENNYFIMFDEDVIQKDINYLDIVSNRKYQQADAGGYQEAVYRTKILTLLLLADLSRRWSETNRTSR